MKTRSKALGKKAAMSAAAIVMAGSLVVTGYAPRSVFANTDANGKWYTDFASYEEEQAYAADLNVKIEEEGIVLLKNENNALPLSKSAKNITLFGARSYFPVYGGSGSGAGQGDYVPLTEALEMAGYNLNGKVQAAYVNNPYTAVVSGSLQGNNPTPVEAPVAKLAGAKSSYAFYHDALIATLTRDGGEGSDLWTKDINTHTDKTDHVLMLDDNEKDMIAEMKKVKAEYGAPIIILINTANPLEIACLEDDPDIDAIVWVGQPGTNGFIGVGNVLNGTVNPSGKLVDVWGANFKHDPVWYNLVEYTDKDNAYDMQEHEEGIYMGYKWYETAAAENVLDKVPYYDEDEATIPDGKNGDIYYNRSSGVVYPFGYGLSYTHFTQEIVSTPEEIKAAIDGATGLDTFVNIKVKVTNKGEVAGKDVVQLYVHAPYTDGGIEKAEVQLVSFNKSKELQPEEEQIVTLQVRLGDIASFDYNDANENEWKGYEIEAGDYTFSARMDSHNVYDSVDVTLAAHTTDLDNDSDPTNNTPLTEDNSYNTLAALDGEEYADAGVPNIGHGSMHLMSRADFIGTFPTTPGHDHDDYIISQITTSKYVNKPYTEFNDEATDPWYKTMADIPADWTQGEGERVNGKCPIQLYQMAGLDIKDTTTVLEYGVTTDVEAFDGLTPAQAWTKFINQLEWSEMTSFLQNASFRTQAIDSIGKDYGEDADGPAQLQNGTFWACEVIIASTWNLELAYDQGVCVGNESLFLDVPGWYGPAFNIHRSPFFGRNYEYYSQDALQGGMIGAQVVAGAQSKGVNCYIKHYGLLGAGTNVYCEFATEQDIRENYFKCFEYAFKFGGATAAMTAGNRLGCRNTSSNYVVDTYIPTVEWGCTISTITDWYWTGCGYMGIMLRCGNYMPLGSVSGNNRVTGIWDPEGRDGKGMVKEDQKEEGGKLVQVADDEIIDAPNQYYYVRTAVTNTLYVAANTSYNENCLDKSQFTNKTVDFTAGVAGNASIAVDTAKFGSSDVLYSVEGQLPAGLSFNASTGVISGTPAAAGTTNVKVVLTADGWSKTSATITVKVSPFLTASTALDTAKVGEEFSSKLSQETYTVGGTYSGGAISKVAYSFQGNAVPGLTLAADGTISGTPEKAGTYEVTVRTAVTYKSGSRDRTANIDTKYTIVVSGEAVVVPEMQIRVNDEGMIQYTADAGETWIDIINTSELKGETGATPTVTISEDGFWVINGEKTTVSAVGQKGDQGPAGPAGEKGDKGDQGVAGEKGDKGEAGAGCGSSIDAISTVAALGLVAVGVAVCSVVRKKKNDKE